MMGRPSSGRTKTAVMMLVDAVRSKDDGRLAQFMEQQRAAHGEVPGECETRAVQT
jgi:hypothetical protein